MIVSSSFIGYIRYCRGLSNISLGCGCALFFVTQLALDLFSKFPLDCESYISFFLSILFSTSSLNLVQCLKNRHVIILLQSNWVFQNLKHKYSRSIYFLYSFIICIPYVQGLSGQPLAGPDIGGFAGNATPRLFGRWMGVGSLFPFCRGHSEAGTNDHEPWSFGEEVGSSLAI